MSKTLTKKIDEVDRNILLLLSENPESSQVELAKKLRITQPAVSARIQKLKEAGMLVHAIGIDAKKGQLFLGKIDILTNNAEKIINFFEKCPLFINGFITSGKHNLMILLVGENMRSIVACIDAHIRPNPDIKDMQFDLIVTPIRDFLVRLKPILDKEVNNPCQEECSSCTFYKGTRCLGCPASINYRGTLF